MSLSDFQIVIEKNIKARKIWAAKNRIEAYRVYDHELEEYPFCVDVYAQSCHVHWSVQSDEGGSSEVSIREIKNILTKALNLLEQRIVFKFRKRQKGKQQYDKNAERKKRFIVREGDSLFWVNLLDYFDTGLFLDHRDSRFLIGQKSKGKRVLNLFSYTAAFSVHAAHGGCRSSLTVDTSNTYLNWAQDNFRLNKLSLTRNTVLKMDAIKYLEDAAKKGPNQFDLIIVDPPTFSNSKTRQKNFEVKKDHVALINNSLRILSKGGSLLFSTNFMKFKMKEDKLDPCTIEDITDSTIPVDFKNSPWMRHCFWIEKPI